MKNKEDKFFWNSIGSYFQNFRICRFINKCNVGDFSKDGLKEIDTMNAVPEDSLNRISIKEK